MASPPAGVRRFRVGAHDLLSNTPALLILLSTVPLQRLLVQRKRYLTGFRVPPDLLDHLVQKLTLSIRAEQGPRSGESEKHISVP